MKTHDGATYQTGVMKRLNGIKSRSRILPKIQAILKRVGFAVLVLWGLCREASADTTWVSGQVGGIWDANGSPYIIVDSAWVVASQGLLVSSGVEILLSDEESYLHLAGNCEFSGEANDSVHITLGGRGERISSDQANTPSVLFHYVQSDGFGWMAIRSDTTRITSCVIESAADSSSTFGNVIEGDYITIHGSSFSSITINYADCVLQRCSFNQALRVSGGSVTIDSLTYSGADPNGHGEVIFVPMQGAELVSIGNSSIRTILSNNGLGSNVPIVIDNVSAEYIEVWEAAICSVANSRLGNVILHQSPCYIVKNVIRHIDLQDPPSASEIRNNTFVELEGRWDPFLSDFLQLDVEENLVLSNNIFYSDQPDLSVYSGVWQVMTPPNYNLAFGMINPWGNLPIDTTNVQVDPLFDPNDPLFGLRHDSPAIDAGDPVQIDSDGTVSDIGARFWDQSFDHPPIIITEDSLALRWGDAFSLSWNAVDEGNVGIEVFGDIPPWIADEFVPFGATSFNVLIVATDESAQRDSCNTVVHVLTRSELPGTLSGVLESEFSPYQALQDVHVDDGDTLLVESGVAVHFGTIENRAALIVRGALLAIGTESDSVRFENNVGGMWQGIAVIGPGAYTSLDYCSVGNSETALYIDSAESVRACHSTLRGRCVLSNAQDSVLFFACEFGDSSSVSIYRCDFLLDSCRFFGNRAAGSSFQSVLSSGTLDGCTFQGVANSGVSIQGGRATVTRCTFFDQQGPYCVTVNTESGDTCSVSLQHNLFLNASGGAVVLNRGSSLQALYGDLTNNIFSCLGTCAARFIYIDSTFVSMQNNCFFNLDSIVSYGTGSPRWETLGTLSAVNINDDSTDAYGNLLRDPLLDSTNRISLLSPCVDAGFNLGEQYIGSGPDIGHFELNVLPVDDGYTEAEETFRCHVFPNPTNGTFLLSILGHGEGLIDVSLINIIGQEVSRWSVGSAIFPVRIALEMPYHGISSGKYYLRVIERKFGQRRVIPILFLK